MTEYRQLRVCVVGAGKHFLSGISYYTLRLVNAMAQSHKVSAILMRKLLPVRLYPGRERVGTDLTQQEYAPSAHIFDGVDWYWLPSIFRSLIFLLHERPDVVVFQWWSGTVLHSYLLLAAVARLLKMRVVIEFHEVLDTAEAKLPLARVYVQLIAPLLVHLAHGFVMHSEYDKKLLEKHYHLNGRPAVLTSHGPYDHFRLTNGEPSQRSAPQSCCNLLFFGVIRPFKGLEDLIMAFDTLSENEVTRYWLTIVGETWEGWTLPSDLINRSKYRDRITFVNRYVCDTEVAQFFTSADAVVLPYHRSSTSGPLHIAMSYGLPVVITCVGGLVEAVSKYDGAILVPPGDPTELHAALLRVAKLGGVRYTDPHSWERTVKNYHTLFKNL